MASGQFVGTDRYTIKRRLGQGGMGVVYEAYDHQRGQSVALKVLSRVDAQGIYRLKREFRSLADVVHPNLVALHDLGSSGDDWFFSMELVDGRSFVDYVRATPEVELSDLTPPWATLDHPESTARDRPLVPADPPESFEPTELAAGAAPHEAPLRLDLPRLRLSLAQLAEAIRAIHAAGKLHRDLKPTNVLITPPGRVVVLDFGLVRDQPEAADEVSLEDHLVAGTPAYMAPEQAAGGRVTGACDWYAMGVMLYVALTGRLPFRGSVQDMLVAKQCAEPDPPSQVAPGVPADLDALCQALLRTHPEARPSAEDVIRRLQFGVTPGVAHPASALPAGPAPPFYGRDAELEALDEAVGLTRVGRPVLTLIEGEAGIGKTALVEHYLDGLRVKGDAVVLRGRCFQRESVPYQAFDVLIDGLSRQLGRLPPHQAEMLLPRNVDDLLRLFPVLGRVEAIASAPRSIAADEDRAELRTRGFAALKELLGRVADREPLVLWVDDLQWGDLDSAELLAHLLSDPDPPALLFIGTFREDETESGEMLARVRDETPAALAGRTRTLRVGPLDHDAAMSVAVDLLGGVNDATWELATRIVREAGSSPLLVTELARYLAGAEDRDDVDVPGDRGIVSLDHALGALLVGLSDDRHRLLQVVAVAGAPVEQRVAARAAEMTEDVRLVAGELATRRLVRWTRSQGADALELAHDRIRTRLLAELGSDQLAGLHRRLGRELEASGRADPEALARHFLAAGERRAAADHAVQAAERALSSLAFERAANLLDFALELRGADDPGRWQLLARSSHALGAAGHSAEAAQRLLQAAECAPPESAVGLAQQATELQVRDVQVGALFHASSAGHFTLFDGIERSEVQALIAQSTVVEGSQGDLIAARGRSADSFLVVLSGELEVRQTDAAIATVGEGEVLGEMAFLLRSQRVVDVYAATDAVRLLALSQASLNALAESNPALALKLVLNLSRIICAKLGGMHERLFERERGVPISSDRV